MMTATHAGLYLWSAGAVAVLTWLTVQHSRNPAKRRAIVRKGMGVESTRVIVALFLLAAALWPLVLVADVVMGRDEEGS